MVNILREDSDKDHKVMNLVCGNIRKNRGKGNSRQGNGVI